jgi:phosphonate transport system substrate-binding protein
MEDRVIRSRRFRAVLALGVALSLTAAACSDDDEAAADDDATTETTAVTEAAAAADSTEDFPESITFAAVPSEESTALQESYAPVIAAIEQELGVEVEFVQATDYAGVIEGMIAGNVDVAQFGPFSYVLAKLNGAEIDAVAALIDEPGATPGYQSYGITRADNADVNGLADFAGKDTCFVDPGSTSGFLYPTAGLIDEGVIASASEADLAAGLEPIFAGGHDASVLSVVNGDCEVGFAYDAMVDTQLIEDGAIKEGDLKVVWKSDVIAGSPVAVSTNLSAAFQEALAKLFTEDINSPRLTELGICDSEADCGVTDEGSWGYAAVEDAFYDGVRAVCETTKSPQCEA